MIMKSEYKERCQKAGRLMKQEGLKAIFLEASTSLYYFTGIKWGQSERLMAAVITEHGTITYLCPHFERERLEEMLLIPGAVFTWQEHESPFEAVASIFSYQQIDNAQVGIEENTRFFVFNGLVKTCPHIDFISADPVVIPCRLIKSSNEIALMQRAFDITVLVFKQSIAELYEGMSQREFEDIARAAHRAHGVEGWISIQFGESTAFPHGSKELTYLKKGDVVLMDGGCLVEGYNSDISRTIVFGEPSIRQQEIWNLEQKAQLAGIAAAQLGVSCGSVDSASRKVLESAGFGPGYELPGLPHRTGHGIGLNGHEWGNIVMNNPRLLEPGMCFSIEPHISIYGEFGMRLEDCVYMDESGAQLFTQPAPSIDEPFVLE